MSQLNCAIENCTSIVSGCGSDSVVWSCDSSEDGYIDCRKVFEQDTRDKVCLREEAYPSLLVFSKGNV